MAGSRDLVFLHRIAGFWSVVGELGINNVICGDNGAAVFAVGFNVMRALGLAGSRNNVHVSCELRTLVLVCNLGENSVLGGDNLIALGAADDGIISAVCTGCCDVVLLLCFTGFVGNFVH